MTFAKRFVFLMMTALFVSSAFAASHEKLTPITLDFAKIPSPPTWLFHLSGTSVVSKLPKLPRDLRVLAEAKRAQVNSNWNLCAKDAQKATNLLPTLAPWITHLQLKCIAQFKTDKIRAQSEASILMRIDHHPQWWTAGAHKRALTQDVITAQLDLLHYDLNHNRSRAWQGIERLTQFEANLSSDQKADLYRIAGELAFAEQHMDVAAAFFQRSLANKPSDEVHQRLLALKSVFHEQLSDVHPKAAPKSEVVSNPDEAALVARITQSLKQGDLLPAAEDQVKLIRQFPGSHQAQWASDQLLNGYLDILEKTDPLYASVRDRYLHQMLKVDGGRLLDWAKKLYGRGYYQDALQLAQEAEPSFRGMAISTSILSLVAHSALNTDDLKLAQDRFQKLVDQSSGTPEAADALFQLGLLDFQKKDFSLAAAQFERLLVVPQVDNWELSARYWLWRSLQNQKSPRANEQMQILLEKFPFSYYGLRARAESGQSIQWAQKQKAPTYRMWLTASQRAQWERINLLLRAGFWEEAQVELGEFPPPVTPEAKALMAGYWAAALDFPKATHLVNEAWDQNPSLRSPPFLELSFPNEFVLAIQNYAQKNRISPLLIQSLIKQESAYGLKATSSSGALGLMQLIPPTAQEMAETVDHHTLTLPGDLFQFETNIRLGTYYLGSLLDKYHNNVPLALASYNAGPAKIDRWLNSRPSLVGLKDRRSSSPADELWIEQLPWSETRFYIKAILRNAIIYQMLDQGRVELSQPIWANLVKERMQAQLK